MNTPPIPVTCGIFISSPNAACETKAVVMLPANLDVQGLGFLVNCKSQEGLVRSAISDSTMRPVMIVLLDPTSDRGSCFFQASILRRPDLLLLQAAMEPFDITVLRKCTSRLNREKYCGLSLLWTFTANQDPVNRCQIRQLGPQS